MTQMDITERLERIGRGEHMDLADIVCADARAEIDRLRGLLGRLVEHPMIAAMAEDGEYRDVAKLVREGSALTGGQQQEG